MLPSLGEVKSPFDGNGRAPVSVCLFIFVIAITLLQRYCFRGILIGSDRYSDCRSYRSPMACLTISSAGAVLSLDSLDVTTVAVPTIIATCSVCGSPAQKFPMSQNGFSSTILSFAKFLDPDNAQCSYMCASNP